MREDLKKNLIARKRNSLISHTLKVTLPSSKRSKRLEGKSINRSPNNESLNEGSPQKKRKPHS